LEARSVERKLAAIFAADVEGYSRLMGRDEVGTLRTLTAYRVIIDCGSAWKIDPGGGVIGVQL
jgi:adenylate cyclase